MELISKAKAVKLRSHLDKYLLADDDQETVRQSRNGSSKKATWMVEFLDNKSNVIRLKSCHGRYLTASDLPFLLGMTGKKVLQTVPGKNMDWKYEWEPIRDGFQVRLKTWCGTFLRGNGGTPPWRNSVTHDEPHSGSTKSWVLWDVEMVEVPEAGSFMEYLSSVSSFSSVSDEVLEVLSDDVPGSRPESPMSVMSPMKPSRFSVFPTKSHKLSSNRCSILLFTPYFSKLILQVQLHPQEFVTGLAIFCCMPTTLSSGVALTQLAGGNSALALAMTIISNLLGILVVPFSISKFIAAGVGVCISTNQLLRSLVLTLLIPVILGKVPWMQVSRSRSLLLMVDPQVFLVAIGLGTCLHLFLLSFNVLAVRSLSAVSGNRQSVFAKKENANAVVLVASQKTLPVMVAVVEQLGGAFGESGLLVLPCVAAHLIQIVLDSLLVNFLLRKDLSSSGTKLA